MDSPCRICSTLTQTPSWAQPRSIAVSDLESGKRQGCKTCTVLSNAALCVVGPEFREIFPSLTFEPRDAADTGPLRIVLYPDGFPYFGMAEKLRLQLYRMPGSSTQWPAIGITNHVALHGLSPSAVQLAQSWISACQSRAGKHMHCPLPRPAVLPSRLVDVGASPTDGCRLHLPADNETGVYLALSHCWGGLIPTRTTRDTFAAFRHRIPEPLPPTFADAVTVTRALGVKYLWVDSLCIIQDSREDWAVQAPLMARVYGGALVTISADAAASSAQGFLAHADRERYRPVRVPRGDDDGDGDDDQEGGGIWARERGVLAYQAPFHGWAADAKVHSDRSDQRRHEFLASVRTRRGGDASRAVGRVLDRFCSQSKNTPPHSQLATRGWVFQERVLAPRTLHFGAAEMGWECRSLISCECSAHSLRYRRTGSLLKGMVSGMGWTDVVAEYSRLDLTVWEDRLVAVAGLAEARWEGEEGEARWGGNRYAAGMWTRGLRAQLLWRTIFRRAPLGSYVAPSWSWASIAGSVHYQSVSPQALGRWEVLSVHCPPAGESMFGNCQAGSFLELEGQVVPVDLSPGVGYESQGWNIRPRGPEARWPVAWQRINLHWDCDERKGRAVTKRETASFVFFIVMAEGEKMEGLLLKELVLTPSAGVTSYERIAYLQERPLSRRRTWSDDSSDDEVEYEDEANYELSWGYWQSVARAVKIRVY